MSTKLKACPFCGGEAEIERLGDRRQSTIYRCTECGCMLETSEEWGHGDRWNARSKTVQDASIDETRKRIVLLEEQVRNLIQSIDLCVGGSVFKRVTDEAKALLGNSRQRLDELGITEQDVWETKLPPAQDCR